ncbi:MAG: hypothetical protein ACREC9_12755 [Methylocella sp.]
MMAQLAGAPAIDCAGREKTRWMFLHLTEDTLESVALLVVLLASFLG